MDKGLPHMGRKEAGPPVRERTKAHCGKPMLAHTLKHT